MSEQGKSDIPVTPEKAPVRDSIIEYEHTSADRPSVPVVAQFLIGFLSPFVYGTLAGILLSLADSSSQAIAALVWVLIAGYAGLVAFVRVRTRWTGFIPGVLACILGLPIVVALLCATVFRF